MQACKSIRATSATLALIALLLIPLKGIAAFINAEDFSYYVPFAVAGYAGSDSLENFPVLVRLADGSPEGFNYNDCALDGSDLRFADGVGNLIPHEIDTWNRGGESLVWVRVPILASGATFRMYYGSDIPGATAADDVWARYAVVIHGGNSLTNAVSGGVAVSAGSNAVSPTTGSGVVGGGVNKSTANAKGVNVVNPAKVGALANNNEFSVSGWFKRTGSGTAILAGSRTTWNSHAGFLWLQEKSDRISVAANNAHQLTTNNKKILSTDFWTHLAFTVDDKVELKSYFDGAPDQTKASPATLLNTSNSYWTFGSYCDTASSDSYAGDMDELRIFNGVASGDWIKAEHDTVASNSFLSVGQATPCEATPAPQMGVSASDVQYTNVTLSVSVVSLGKNTGMTSNAEWLDAVVLVAAEDTFAPPVISLPLARQFDAPVLISVSAVALATNTTYYAKVLATNEFDVAGESSVAQFTTLLPGAPAGMAVFVERGFTTLSARVSVSDFGIGAEGATIRLEASADDFATIATSYEVPATLDVQEYLTTSGLVPNTAYALRVRIRNDWGIDTYIPLPGTATRSVPFATAGIGWTFAHDGSTIDISFAISGVYDGATGTAKLTYDGVEHTTQAVSGIGTLTWPAIPAANGPAAATVVLSATLDGQPYSQTFAVTIAPGSAAVSVVDIAEHQSAETSVHVNIGDVITLPELVGTDFYYLGNNRFGSLEGNILTATEGGILGVFHVADNGATTNTLPVIVLPEPIGSGSIYILKDGQIKDWANWDDASKWEKVGSSENNSWPKDPDDIAIAAYWRNTGTIQIEPRSGDISLGALYVGNFRDAESKFSVRNNNKVIFNRTDGKPALIQFCANDRLTAKTASVTFANSIVGVEFTCDTVVDGGWDGIANNCPAATFEFNAPYFLLPEGKTLLFQNFSPTRSGEGTTISHPFTGSGLIWNRSTVNINWTDSSLNSFAGTVRDSGHGISSFNYSAPLFLKTSAPNALAEVVGFVAANADANPSITPKGAGIMQTSQNQAWRDAKYHVDQWFTGKGLRLNGGAYQSNPVEQAWGYGLADKKVGDILALGGGLNYVSQGNSRDQLKGYPVNWVEFDAVEHEDKSSLVLWGSFWGNGTASTADASVTNCEKSVMETIPAGSTATNHVIILSGISSEAVGSAGDPLTSATHPVVPWILMPRNNSGNGWSELGFASFDGDDRLVSTPKVVSVTSLTADDAVGANVTFWDRTIEISKDVTVNSLELGNQNKNKWLGAGRTLTISSGGLVLRNHSSAIGLSGRADNGSLVLGDATHPAYVWARSNSGSSPNQIWADVTAPGGFVAAYTGHLVLGGDQTGIGDEIAVNAGTLILGTAESTCSLAAELPIRIFANATLSLPNDSSTAGNILKFDGSAGWFGKVEVPAGVAAKCKKAYWRDYPEMEEWQNLKRGIYGSSESGAPNVRDDLFVGAGTLQILRDDLTLPFVILVR